jgi:Protein of unknown function (DUF2726)
MGQKYMTDSLFDQIAVITVMLFFAMVAGIYLERWRAKKASAEWRAKNAGRWKKNSKQPNQLQPRADPVPISSPDPVQQLRVIMEAEFKAKPLLNYSESRVFVAVEKIIQELKIDWRVMAQVNLGEILSSPNKEAFWAINAKRVDLLLIDSRGMPLHAIEYQGTGHHISRATAARDAVKKEALRRAGIGYIDVSKGDTTAELRATLGKLAGRSVQNNVTIPRSAN